MKMKIGFIGQGWVGYNYANDFEKRGYDVIRYSLDKKYINNREIINSADIIFVAVPTPTVDRIFDDSFLRSALSTISKGKIVVIKSTLIFGKTIELQEKYKDLFIFHSPEFLSRKTAAYDAENPERNIIGMPKNTTLYRTKAKMIMSVLAKAPYELICSSNEAEFIKYGHNVNGYIQVVYSNLLLDLAKNNNMKWDNLKSAFMADPLMAHRYLNPLDGKGRGAGGDCFIKDFEAFIEITKKSKVLDEHVKMLETIRNINVKLLVNSGKDMDLVRGVYSKKFLERIGK